MHAGHRHGTDLIPEKKIGIFISLIWKTETVSSETANGPVDRAYNGIGTFLLHVLD